MATKYIWSLHLCLNIENLKVYLQKKKICEKLQYRLHCLIRGGSASTVTLNGWAGKKPTE